MERSNTLSTSYKYEVRTQVRVQVDVHIYAHVQSTLRKQYEVIPRTRTRPSLSLPVEQHLVHMYIVLWSILVLPLGRL